MKVLVSLAMALAGCTLLPAQYDVSGNVMNSNLGITIWFDSKLEPPAPEPTFHGRSGITNLENARPGMRRYQTDEQTHEYFGYDMNIDPLDQTKEKLRVMFTPLPTNAKNLELQNPTEWHRAQPPIFPPPQTVGINDKIAVTLFEDPVSHQKVVDYIHFTRDNCDSETPNPGQVNCLTGQLQDARHTLSQQLSQLQSQPDLTDALTVGDSQRAWETYLQTTCAKIVSEPKRLQCELRLTRNRLRDLGSSSAESHK